jgi:hypothetical protein
MSIRIMTTLSICGIVSENAVGAPVTLPCLEAITGISKLKTLLGLPGGLEWCNTSNMDMHSARKVNIHFCMKKRVWQHVVFR